MDVKYINPFINSVVTTMEMMVNTSPKRLAPFLKDNNIARGDVSGIIGFASQEIVGSVALTFPEKTVKKIYSVMMGEETNGTNEDIQDTVGELANIIAGGAKEEFSSMGITYHISIPTVVVGKNHSIVHKGGTHVMVVPFKLENNAFFMEISIKLKNNWKKNNR